ncbi:DMT family transporter [Paenibacillus durus]|uniref:Transporter n=1 Tax=Paenibacillus durus TaxID=44251 RepID=A0A089IWT9_PAEDU|nr:DMT family transporter [Paenibacillus durus]AIQ13399.1 transporter [Paenibacillus durus]
MSKAKISFIISMLIFGSIGLFVRNIPFSSSQIALVRGLVGSLLLFAASFVFTQRLSWKRIRPNLWLLAASGIALGMNWIFLFQAYHYTTIANATICYYFAPIFVMFLSPLILKESLKLINVLCILSAMAGMLCIVGIGGGAAGTNNILGIGYGLTAAAFYAIVVMLNKFLKNISGIESSFMQLFISALSLIPYVLTNDGFQISSTSGTSIGLLVIVGVVHTGVAYLIYFSALRKLSSQYIAAFSYIDPISAILMSSIFLHEGMTLLQIFGGILILGAAFVNEMAGTKKVDSAESRD